MAKVRVPRYLRPPERFRPFRSEGPYHWGKFRVKAPGIYRLPKAGEYFWYSGGYVGMAMFDWPDCPRVILEEVG